ncbi:MAG: lactonase family protein, partial [Mariniphaga sp.]|nr:lactonase family protein [Mariniphaga sp.]
MYYIKQVFFILFICFNLVTYGQQSNKVLFYVGTFSGSGAEGIYLCSFDTVTGDLNLENVIKGLENPNYLIKSIDGKYLYVCMRPRDAESDNFSVGVYKINLDGSLKFINEQPAEGTDPCYVDITPDNKFVAISNYGNGTIAMYKTNNDGSLNPAYQVIQHNGSGANTERRKGPHAHSIQFSPFSDKVYAADLGTDKLMIYDFDKTQGKLSDSKIPFAAIPPGAGPRHFDFHPNGKFIYVVNELNSSVSVVNIKKNYEVVQTISTLPEGFDGTSYCADIHISSNGKYLYCSNRGHNSITTFEVKNNGILSQLAATKTMGDWPRNFSLSPNKKFMLVA